MQFMNMISGRVQIDPFAGPKATGAVANGKSPGATGDISVGVPSAYEP